MLHKLPRELVDAILQQCVGLGSRNVVLELRLVCRAFDYRLKPYACRTLGLDFSRLSRLSGRAIPSSDALQTIGKYCQNVYIDLMVLRDELEVEFLETVFARVPSMDEFCRLLRTRYCMNEASFNDTHYYKAVEELLFNCNYIEGLRLNLPFQLVGPHCQAATRILANTIKAFSLRSEEDRVPLTKLVLENITDVAMRALWLNPMDVVYMKQVMRDVQHLVLTLRRHESEAARVRFFGHCLYNLIGYANQLESLCLVGMDHDDRPPRGLKQTRHWQMTVEEWRAKEIPLLWQGDCLTCLELKRVEVSGSSFSTLMREHVGHSIEELYLNEVYLKTEQSATWNEDSKKILWVGLHNERPAEDTSWLAMEVRTYAPHLRICRASFLAYDLYLRDDTTSTPEFDLVDPCGLGRSISQRFVDVVLGIEQLKTPSGEEVIYLPKDYKMDKVLQDSRPRPRSTLVVDYDTNAYQTAIANSTSTWQRSIDGYFTNCNQTTLDELHYIAETACQGMNEIHRRRSEWTAGSSMANEYADNLLEDTEVEQDIV